MVPTTIIGVLLTIVLLAPGFVYLETRERYHPGIKYSPIRETSFVIITSLSTLCLSVALFAVVRSFAPGSTPDIGAYIRGGTREFRSHYLQGTVWGITLVTVACLLAYIAAHPPERLIKFSSHLPVVGDEISKHLSKRRGNGPIRAQSGWGLAVTLLPDTQQWIDVVLLDGTCAHGLLRSYSTQIEETAERDLLLAAPIQVRAAGASEWTPLAAGTLVVSASRISYFTVQYTSH